MEEEKREMMNGGDKKAIFTASPGGHAVVTFCKRRHVGALRAVCTKYDGIKFTLFGNAGYLPVKGNTA